GAGAHGRHGTAGACAGRGRAGGHRAPLEDHRGAPLHDALRARDRMTGAEESVGVTMVSEVNEPGSESGKRSDDRRGVPEGTPQEGGASTPLAAPGSFAAAATITRTAS